MSATHCINAPHPANVNEDGSDSNWPIQCRAAWNLIWKWSDRGATDASIIRRLEEMRDRHNANGITRAGLILQGFIDGIRATPDIMTATNWTTRDRWRDVSRGVCVGVIIACTAIAYSPRLVSALHALGSPRPAMAAAPVLASTSPDWLSPAERVQAEDTAALVELMRLPVTTPRQRTAPAHTDQIGD